MRRIVKIGITGGIGSGKTYACSVFNKHRSVPIFNTDNVVKSDIIRRDTVKRQVIAEFGKDSYLSDGSINQEKFKSLLFNDLEKKRTMDKIVGVELIPAINEWTERQNAPYVLVECAIIYENGVDKFLDGVIVVTCPKELRVKRLLQRGVSQTDIDNVMRAQWSDEQKIKLAEFVLINDETLQYRVEQLDDLLRIYAKELAKRKAEMLQYSRKGTEAVSV